MSSAAVVRGGSKLESEHGSIGFVVCEVSVFRACQGQADAHPSAAEMRSRLLLTIQGSAV